VLIFRDQPLSFELEYIGFRDVKHNFRFCAHPRSMSIDYSLLRLENVKNEIVKLGASQSRLGGN
jgi:hypothetical protein